MGSTGSILVASPPKRNQPHQVLCKSYLKDQCQRGNACRFLHDPAARKAEGVASSSSDASANNSLCWAGTECENEACNYHHPDGKTPRNQPQFSFGDEQPWVWGRTGSQEHPWTRSTWVGIGMVPPSHGPIAPAEWDPVIPAGAATSSAQHTSWPSWEEHLQTPHPPAPEPEPEEQGAPNTEDAGQWWRAPGQNEYAWRPSLGPEPRVPQSPFGSDPDQEDWSTGLWAQGY